MIRFVLGFAAGAALVLALVFLGILTPSTVRSVSQDPQRGLAEAADNMVQQVKEGAKNLRTNAEAAAMVTGKTGEAAVCHREGLTTRQVCRTKTGQVYRVMGNDVVLFKGDLKVLDPDLEGWLKRSFEDLLENQAQASNKARSQPAVAK